MLLQVEVEEQGQEVETLETPLLICIHIILILRLITMREVEEQEMQMGL